MKFKDVKVGMMVEDTWWPYDVSGKVIKKLKTMVHVRLFCGAIWQYDKEHVQFLRRNKHES